MAGREALGWTLLVAMIAVPAPAFAQLVERDSATEFPQGPPDHLRREDQGTSEEQEAALRDADLFSRPPIARAAGWFLRPEPAPSGREEQAEEELDRFFHDEIQEQRLATLGANPWYNRMQRAMRRTLRPDMDQFRREQQAGMSDLQRVYNFLRRYGGGYEAPQDVAGQLPADQRPELDGMERQMQDIAEYANPNNAPVTWYRVDVRLTQNPEGEHIGSRVIRSSGYRELDRAAVEAVRNGAQSMPAPPEDIVGELDAIRSDWAVEVGDVATQLGSVGCVEDPREGSDIQCSNPLTGDGIIRTRVRLLRLVDADHPMFEVQRMETRRDPPRLRL